MNSDGSAQKYTNKNYRDNDIHSTSLHLPFSVIMHVLSLILGKRILPIQYISAILWFCMWENSYLYIYMTCEGG